MLLEATEFVVICYTPKGDEYTKILLLGIRESWKEREVGGGYVHDREHQRGAEPAGACSVCELWCSGGLLPKLTHQQPL